MVLYLDRMCQCGLYGWFGHTSVHLCASSLLNLAVPHYFYFIISFSVERSWWTLFDSVVWRVWRAGGMPFHWPICSLAFSILLVFLSLLSFDGLVWGWGLQTDMVLIALPSLALPNFFKNNNCERELFFVMTFEKNTAANSNMSHNPPRPRI